MQLIHPGPEEAALCLRAVRTAANRNGVIPPAARALMTAAKQAILHIDADLDELAPITPAELAAGLHTPGLAEQVTQAMIVCVLADGEPDPPLPSGPPASSTARAQPYPQVERLPPNAARWHWRRLQPPGAQCQKSEM